MIKLSRVSKQYTYGKHLVDAVKDVDLTIQKGEACCVCGASGSGKSTLLHIVGGMLMPSAGTVEVNGTEMTTLPLHFLSAFRRENIGFIFQQFNLLPQYTVVENVLFPLLPQGKNITTEKARLMELLERLRIAHRADFPVSYLSGGEQQRVAVARSLACDPAVIVADEPFSSLDPENSTVILKIFQELKEGGKTFFLSATSKNGPEQHFVDQEIDYSC